MRILITGISGFVGKYLAEYLRQVIPDAKIHGTTFRGVPAEKVEGVQYHSIDLRERDRVNALIQEILPDRIFHLAAYSFVPDSFANPWETIENNTKSQLNLFEACRVAKIQPQIVVASSAAVYGPVRPDEVPLKETSPLRPTTPYGVSKITQDMLALQYTLTYNWHIVRARAFNHIGPGQIGDFVAPAFALQIARIEAGEQEPIIRVGDLSAKRDFTDVRDVVRAYHLMIEKGIAGEDYNIACGEAYSIQYILDELIRLSVHKGIHVEVDETRLRPSGTPILQGDYTKLREATGWMPEIPFEQTLLDILNDFRQRVKTTA